MPHPPPASPSAPPAATQVIPDRDRRRPGRWAGIRGAFESRRFRRLVAIPTAVLAVAVAGITVGWLVADLPADWRTATAVGAVLAAGAIGLGTPVLTRARQELNAAQQLMETAGGELARMNDELRRTAAARDQALSDLRTTVADRQMFLTAIAHELNSPLTVIKGHVQLMAGRLDRDEPPDREHLTRGITRITGSVQQLTGLVDEFLWLARLDINEPIALDRRPTDLIALVNDIVADQAATISRHRIRVDSECDRLVGRWDARRLGRAIGNLIANAIKFSPSGGDIDITVATERQDSLAIVTVVDHGLGIAAADLPHVFDRFYRGESVKLTTSGTGLGLATVKHAVEAHGGTVSVESQEGRGATFSIRLPIDAGSEAGSGVPAIPAQHPSETDPAANPGAR